MMIEGALRMRGAPSYVRRMMMRAADLLGVVRASAAPSPVAIDGVTVLLSRPR
jgi:hypothetical protein